MRYREFLSKVHDLLAPNSYLEIGVRGGHSMALSRAKSIGIDPAFKLVEELGEHVTLSRTTSDDFFAGPDPLAPFDEPSIDLAFIDGMHLYEYVLRDFMNVERHSRWGSVIVLDDILPRTREEALRDRETRAWTGDVWKIIPTLSALRPDLFCLQVATQPTGLLLVLGADPENDTLQKNYDQLIEQYGDQDAQPPDDILDRAGAIAPETVLAAPFWQLFRDHRTSGRSRPDGLPELTRVMRDWSRQALTGDQAGAANASMVETGRLRGLTRRLSGRGR